jgi:lipopolysaccharide biosynthesis glycosyltransferase
MDLGTYVFGAVHDLAAVDWNMFRKHGIPEKYLYFNSGVLLVDRRKWCACGATERVFGYIREHIDLCRYHDQDGLNAVLYKERYPLPPVWNQQIGLYFIKQDVVLKTYGKEAETALRDPVIVHFNGIEKPWHYVCGHPWTASFRRASRQAALIGRIERPTFRKMVKQHVVYPVLGWKRLSGHYYYLSNADRIV